MTDVGQGMLLTGYVNPMGARPTFIVPLFQTREGGNEWFEQVIDSRGRVAGFRTAAYPSNAHLSNPQLRAKIGTEAFWGFEFSDGRTVIEPHRALIRTLLSMPEEFEGRPFLHLQLFRYAGDGALPNAAVKTAFDYLSGISAESGAAWRDAIALPELIRGALVDSLSGSNSADLALVDEVEVARKHSALQITLPTEISQALKEDSGASEAFRRRVDDVSALFGIAQAEFEAKGAAAIGVESVSAAIPDQATWVIGIGPAGANLLEPLFSSTGPAISPPTTGATQPRPIAGLSAVGITVEGVADLGELAGHLPRPRDGSADDAVVFVTGFRADGADVEGAAKAAKHYSELGYWTACAMLRPDQFGTRQRNWLRSHDFRRLQQSFDLFLVLTRNPSSLVPIDAAREKLIGILNIIQHGRLPALGREVGQLGLSVVGASDMRSSVDVEGALGTAIYDLQNEDVFYGSAQHVYCLVESGPWVEAGVSPTHLLLQKLDPGKPLHVWHAPSETLGSRTKFTILASGLDATAAPRLAFENLCREALEREGWKVEERTSPPGSLHLFVSRDGQAEQIVCRWSSSPITSTALERIAEHPKAEGLRFLITNAALPQHIFLRGLAKGIIAFHYSDIRLLGEWSAAPDQMFVSLVKEFYVSDIESILREDIDEFVAKSIVEEPMDFALWNSMAAVSRNSRVTSVYVDDPSFEAALSDRELELRGTMTVEFEVAEAGRGVTYESMPGTFTVGLSARGLRLIEADAHAEDLEDYD